MSFLALFELGPLLCGVAASSKMFIIGRAVAGMGGSGLMNGAFTIIAICMPMDKRAGTATSSGFFEKILMNRYFIVYIGIMMGSEQISGSRLLQQL
jgi:MFS family permease